MLISTFRYDQFRAPHGRTGFYDEMSYLIGSPKKDDLKSLTLIYLYQDTDVWNYGLMSSHQQYIYSESNSAALYGLVSYIHKPFRATVGLGAFRTSHQVQRPAMVFQLTFTGIKSLSLM